MILNCIELIDFHIPDLSRFLSIAHICGGVQSYEQEKEGRRDCIILPGRSELRENGMERKKLSLVCVLRVENRCDEKTGICILLGDRSELQRSSCTSVWCSVNGTRKRNGEKAALGSTELGTGIAISVRNGSVAPSDLVHPFVRIIFEFTVEEMETKCVTSDGELISLGPGVCTIGLSLHCLCSCSSPIFIWI